MTEGEATLVRVTRNEQEITRLWAEKAGFAMIDADLRRVEALTQSVGKQCLNQHRELVRRLDAQDRQRAELRTRVIVAVIALVGTTITAVGGIAAVVLA